MAFEITSVDHFWSFDINNNGCISQEESPDAVARYDTSDKGKCVEFWEYLQGKKYEDIRLYPQQMIWNIKRIYDYLPEFQSRIRAADSEMSMREAIDYLELHSRSRSNDFWDSTRTQVFDAIIAAFDSGRSEKEVFLLFQPIKCLDVRFQRNCGNSMFDAIAGLVRCGLSNEQIPSLLNRYQFTFASQNYNASHPVVALKYAMIAHVAPKFKALGFDPDQINYLFQMLQKHAGKETVSFHKLVESTSALLQSGMDHSAVINFIRDTLELGSVNFPEYIKSLPSFVASGYSAVDINRFYMKLSAELNMCQKGWPVNCFKGSYGLVSAFIDYGFTLDETLAVLKGIAEKRSKFTRYSENHLFKFSPLGNLLERLQAAGYDKDFARDVILEIAEEADENVLNEKYSKLVSILEPKMWKFTMMMRLGLYSYIF